jgi:predicted membrane protein (TIGR00267 family)
MAHRGELSRKSAGDLLSDFILGSQDGLVNVLGVILGVAAASHSRNIIIAGGLAATFAESISMAAVALTSKMAERDHFIAELEREKREMKETPEKEIEEIRTVYEKRGFDGKILDDIVDHIRKNSVLWLDLMMREELEIKKVEDKEIYTSSLIVGGAALVGSFVPITPYFFLPMKTALVVTLIISAIALFVVGVYKAKFTTGKLFRSGLQITIIGMTAALAGYLIGKLFGAQ